MQEKPQAIDMDPDQIAAVLDTLRARGFELPLTWCAIASNGSILAGRYIAAPDGTGLRSEVLASHIEGQGLQRPVNLIFIDSRGEAASVVFDASGAAVLH